MNDALKMQISAFVDGELPENETELLMRRLSQDAALREQVAHYLALGRMIRQEQEAPHIGELRGRILATLGEEPDAAAAVAVEPGSRLVRPAVGIAIAASVALLAIVGLQQTVDPGVDATDSGLTAGAQQAMPEGITEPAIDEAMLEMQRRHARSASDLGSSDMLSRFVTLEIRQDRLVEVEPEAGDDTEDEDDADTAPSPTGQE